MGEVLRGLVKTAKEEVRTGTRMIERVIGRFGGFDLGILAANKKVERPWKKHGVMPV